LTGAGSGGRKHKKETEGRKKPGGNANSRRGLRAPGTGRRKGSPTGCGGGRWGARRANFRSIQARPKHSPGPGTGPPIHGARWGAHWPLRRRPGHFDHSNLQPRGENLFFTGRAPAGPDRYARIDPVLTRRLEAQPRIKWSEQSLGYGPVVCEMKIHRSKVQFDFNPSASVSSQIGKLFRPPPAFGE